MGWSVFDVFAAICVGVVVFLVLLVLFEPGLRYRICPRRVGIETGEFLELLGVLCDAEVRAGAGGLRCSGMGRVFMRRS